MICVDIDRDGALGEGEGRWSKYTAAPSAFCEDAGIRLSIVTREASCGGIPYWFAPEPERPDSDAEVG